MLDHQQPATPAASPGLLGKLAAFWPWVVGWLMLETAIVGWLVTRRPEWIAAQGTAEQQAAWQTWREEVAHEAKLAKQNEQTLPVQRKIPKSSEPPTLVMLRDHFPVVLVAAVTFSSLSFGFIALITRGLTGRRAN